MAAEPACASWTGETIPHSSRRTTLRPVCINRRAAPGVATARSSTTSWTGGDDPPQYTQADQNIAVAAMLLRGLLEPDDP